MGWSRRGCNREGVSICVSCLSTTSRAASMASLPRVTFPAHCSSAGVGTINSELPCWGCLLSPPLLRDSIPPCRLELLSDPLCMAGSLSWGRVRNGLGMQCWRAVGGDVPFWCPLTSVFLSLAGFVYSFEMKRSILNQQYLAALRQIAVVFLTNWNTMAPFLILTSSSVSFLWVL